MSSFVDTNVSIGYIFTLDPFNHKSRKIFEEYEDLLWSKFVKYECTRIFNRKKGLLFEFYENLRADLKPENFHDFEFNDLKRYIDKNYSEDKEYKQILSSLKPFWHYYVKEFFPTYISFKRAINDCLNDLRIVSYANKKEWEENILLTSDRVDEYLNLKKKLNSLNVHYPDDNIVLDAHDHNLKVEDNINFITFDMDFYNAVSRIDDFSFNEVLGKWDFS